MTYYFETRPKPVGIRRFSLLGALLRADRAYRDRQKMLSLTDEQLADVGLNRSDLRKI